MPATRRLSVVLGGLSMLGAFAIDTIFPAFPRMAASLGVDDVGIQQSISIYLLAYAAMSLLHGPLSDAMGRRRVIIGGLLVFVLASAGCALSTSLPMLLLFRALQGLSAGVGMIVGRAVIRDVLHGDEAQRLMSQVSMIFSIAPAIAPVFGGWVLGWQEWPAIFWALAVFGLLLLAMVWRGLPETHPPQARIPLGLGSLLRGYAGILRNPRFLRLAASGACGFGAVFLYIASAPVFVLRMLGLGERDFGWFFIPMITGMAVGSFVAGRVSGRLDGRRLAMLGFACCGLAAALNVAGNLVAEARVPWAVLPVSLCAFGVALAFPVLTLAVLDMYPGQRGTASSLQAFAGLLLNAVLAGVLSPVLTRSPLVLACGSAALTAAGWLFWWWEMRFSARLCAPREPAGLEPDGL